MQVNESGPEDLATIAMLVSESNKDVALRFGLNSDNCPKHPSLCTEAWVKEDLTLGERYFILYDKSTPIACVAFKLRNENRAYLNRLSVLPEHRGKGIGARMVQFIVELAAGASIKTISIGIIGEHTELEHWYQKLGFTSGELKRFPHLPFSVRYMAYAIPKCPQIGR